MTAWSNPIHPEQRLEALRVNASELEVAGHLRVHAVPMSLGDLARRRIEA